MHDTLKSPQPLGLFPEKLFYKIGEVSRIVGVESYVLRYWETEFPFLSPMKSKSGQRIYTKKDIELILQIKKLLYEKKYTIDGARKNLSDNIRQIDAQPCAQEKDAKQCYNITSDRKFAEAKRLINMVKESLRKILNS